MPSQELSHSRIHRETQPSRSADTCISGQSLKHEIFNSDVLVVKLPFFNKALIILLVPNKLT